MTINKRLIFLALLVMGMVMSACSTSEASKQLPTLAVVPTSNPTSTIQASTIQPSETQAVPPTIGPSPTRATVYLVTVTASGPLLGTDRNYVGKLMASVPAQLGGFNTTVGEQGFDGTASFLLSNKDVSLTVTLDFWPTGSEYNSYQLNAAQMPNGQIAPIADGAKVDAQNDNKVAIMFYRNVEVSIDPPWNALNPELRPTTIPFTNDQLTAILTDIYEKILKNAP